MTPQPSGLARWVDGAFEFLEKELKYARRVPASDPKQYIVTIDNTLIKGELRELFAARAAGKTEKKAKKGRTRRGFKGDTPGQMKMFD